MSEHVVKRRIKWTQQMNLKLLECKRKAKLLAESNEPPRNDKGRKKGYMVVMKELWEEAGYAELKLTSQNLRDKAANLEKTMGNVMETVSLAVGEKDQELEEREKTHMPEDLENNIERESEMNIHISTENEFCENIMNLNINLSEGTPERRGDESYNPEVNELLSKASIIYNAVVETPGEFKTRHLDTRIKQKPTKLDARNVNTVISTLVNKHLEQSQLSMDPFWTLWIINCIVYAVVSALLLIKGWKKQKIGCKMAKRKVSNKMEEENTRQVKELRRKISIAHAELERMQQNNTITKKGKKNRSLLIKECGPLSAATLVGYMERKKYELRKLKRSTERKKRVEESRLLNKRFEGDRSGVYVLFDKIIAMDSENEKPTYQKSVLTEEKTSEDVFDNITDASSFWKTLWETRGIGNSNCGWLKEIERAIDKNVPNPVFDQKWELTTEDGVKVVRKKRNWSAPGPDRIANYWWKYAYSIHGKVVECFRAISTKEVYPMWFTQGKTTLIPKPGEFSSQNHRPITCLNTLYKWYTACLLAPINVHLAKYNLMEDQQRGAKAGCSGTMDNLIIDRMVLQDCVRGNRNISMAWIDVKKAFDSVDHGWLCKVMKVHKFPQWICSVITNICSYWNTKIVVTTKKGLEVSEPIHFKRGLPQGDSLCPALFTLCLNPVAWMLRATEGYKLSKPIIAKVTDLLFIDDLKVYAQSQTKLNKVLMSTQEALKDIGLDLNPKKCSIANVKRGKQVFDGMKVNLEDAASISSLKEGEMYKFLGVLESLKQNDTMALKIAAKKFIQRASVIWSSPLSDWNKVKSTNEYALSSFRYLMWTQIWPLAELRQIDREFRKIMVSHGGRHPTSSNAILYLPRNIGGRGLRSVEQEYKLTKIKGALKVYESTDPTIKVVREFDENAMERGHHSVAKDAIKFAEELKLNLDLKSPQCLVSKVDGEEISRKNIKGSLKKSVVNNLVSEVEDQKWEGKLLASRWKDVDLDRRCFEWMGNWKNAPTHVITGIHELYQQLLPTKLYSGKKIKTTSHPNYNCRMCGKGQESVSHVLAGCSAIAQTKYLERHNNVLRILFFEILSKYSLLPRNEYAWYKRISPKPVYENENIKALWDVPLYAEQVEVRANRIDAQVIDREKKEVILIEMSCPWMENRQLKTEEKTRKYGPLRWELKLRYPGYKISQYNIIMDVLGGYSKEVRESVKCLVGDRCDLVLKQMQKAMLSCTLSIARNFKIIEH